MTEQTAGNLTIILKKDNRPNRLFREKIESCLPKLKLPFIITSAPPINGYGNGDLDVALPDDHKIPEDLFKELQMEITDVFRDETILNVEMGKAMGVAVVEPGKGLDIEPAPAYLYHSRSILPVRINNILTGESMEIDLIRGFRLKANKGGFVNLSLAIGHDQYREVHNGLPYLCPPIRTLKYIMEVDYFSKRQETNKVPAVVLAKLGRSRGHLNRMRDEYRALDSAGKEKFVQTISDFLELNMENKSLTENSYASLLLLVSDWTQDKCPVGDNEHEGENKA